MSIQIEPKQAATVVLLRDGAAGLETFIMVRAPSMAFGAGAAVFPGGKIDEADSDIFVDYPLNAHKVAAFREVFEEAGGLLATRDGHLLTSDEVLELQPWRIRLEKRDIDFSEFCKLNNLQPDFDALNLIARWRTPKHLKQRFDTYFFMAVMPEGQALMHDGGELVSSYWHAPQAVLTLHHAGDLSLMPPTYWTLQDLCKYQTADEAVAALARDTVKTCEPTVIKSHDQIIFQAPGRKDIRTTTANKGDR